MSAPNVIVFLPGILGSELKLNGELIWPGTVLEYVRGYRRMPQLLDRATRPGDIIRSYGPLKQYVTLIKDLNTCGFTEKSAPASLYVCPYDWRQDNALSANTLADCLDEAMQAHSGNANIALIAHSMGGLVARYYLESGKFFNRPAFKAISQLITLATPHKGAPLALAAAAGQISRLFLNEAQVQQLANNPDYPSLYQLLPAPQQPFAWSEDVGEQYRPLDVFDAQTAAKLGLVTPNLDSARNFFKSLTLPGRPVHVRYFAFFGTELRTITTIGLLSRNAQFRIRPIDAEYAGDATVPSWSAAIDGVQCQPVGGEHGVIFRDRTLLRVLAGLLGKQGLLAAEVPAIDLVVRERVVKPDAPLNIYLSLPRPVDALEGAIRFRVIPVDPSGREGTPVATGGANPVRYTGSAITRLNLLLNAPSLAGFYEADFVAESGVQASDRFVVQA